ncbi:MAG: ArdC-like ssDNA-binding domain-containing protein [Actinomycetota bacterium]|nr:ArdC-like ssDNA-binding domain-containing protein [Actinomycetota bacterium]
MARVDVQAHLAQLRAGVAALASSAAWQRHLEFQSRFHRYSPRNVMLIAAQCEHASYVASYRHWQRLGRFVRKGERAIWIFAPVLVRNHASREGREEAEAVRGFRLVPVFDLSQTDGEAVPSLCELVGAPVPAEHYERLCLVARRLGYSVQDHDFAGAANGDCNHAERRLRVEVANPAAQRLKTLAHELGHAVLHADCADRSLAELEAESVAYVLCRIFGVDTGSYSFGYVTAWAGGGEEAIAAINASCERIHRAVSLLSAPGVDGPRHTDP